MQRNTIRKLLNIPEYKVVRVSSTASEIQVWLAPYKRNKPVCSGCGRSHTKGYHGMTEVIVEDISLGERRTYLHVSKKRYRCPVTNQIHVEKISWLNLKTRITRKFGEKIYRLTAITTNKEAGWFLGLDDEKVYRADKEILEEKAKEKLEPIPTALNMSVDEVSYRKYHRYLTNVIDTDRRLLIWNANGRKAEVLSLYYKGIGKESCLKIESVAMDGARTYISSTQAHAKNAMIVYDKFHIVQKLNKAVDAVRKAELHKARRDNNKEVIEFTNSKQRFILFKKKTNLTENQSKRLEELCQLNEPIYKAMLLKESFLNIYNPQNESFAEALLVDWLKDAANSSLESFQELAKSFTDKMQFILNWFKKRISSAISEGFNNKIKRLKRMAYGYRDIDYFRMKIHQHCGLLNPRIAT